MKVQYLTSFKKMQDEWDRIFLDLFKLSNKSTIQFAYWRISKVCKKNKFSVVF